MVRLHRIRSKYSHCVARSSSLEGLLVFSASLTWIKLSCISTMSEIILFLLCSCCGSPKYAGKPNADVCGFTALFRGAHVSYDWMTATSGLLEDDGCVKPDVSIAFSVIGLPDNVSCELPAWVEFFKLRGRHDRGEYHVTHCASLNSLHLTWSRPTRPNTLKLPCSRTC